MWAYALLRCHWVLMIKTQIRKLLPLMLMLELVFGLLFFTPNVSAITPVLVPGAAPRSAGSLASYHRASWYKKHPKSRRAALKAVYRSGSSTRKGKGWHTRTAAAKHKRHIAAAPKPIPPQKFITSLSQQTLTPGVIYRHYNGALNINVIDADLASGKVLARPVLASNNFSHLTQVKNDAVRSGAIAAVNANYFKKNGTPLGTLIIDNEWITGNLYDRVSMGFTKCGYARMDRVDLHGILKTSNSELPSIWINNLNQPRTHGAKLVMYTQRWGQTASLAYDGCLLAVDHEGRIIERQAKQIAIPNGGYVLSDSKTADISKLNIGDVVSLQWEPKPSTWSDVIEAVSGGPILVRDGQLYIDLKDESFRKSWTSSRISARTALGVTRNNHLLLVTVEGPHTLWDVAKFMQRLGAVDAMNLAGGGSTTMVVQGKIVSRNATHFQRPVASALAIVPAGMVEELHTAAVPAWLSNVQDTGKSSSFGIEQAAAAKP
jgi:hypothetical protein